MSSRNSGSSFLISNFASIFVLLFWVIARTVAFVPYCPCVLFNSTGDFYSPNYPDYISNLSCVFYHFQAPPDHIVQLAFHNFQLPIRRGSTCSSSVKFFDHSLDGLVDVNERPDFEFCEREIAPGRIFYSRYNHFLIQVQHAADTSKGFVGDYRFISRANYSTDAAELSEYSYRVEKLEGTLYSLDYPYFYPSFLNCTYILPQKKGYLTIISSSLIDLGNDAQIDIFESSTKGKNKLQTLTSDSHNLYASSTSTLLIYFKAGENKWNRGRGLVIEFVYEKTENWSKQLAADESIQSVAECMISITSESEKVGIFSSKQITHKANTNLPTKCRIVLQGFPNERISVKFTHFRLYVPDNLNVTKRCGDVDNLTADVRVGTRLSRIEEWCGETMPPQLMSSSHLMQLEYTTKSSRVIRESSKIDYGFALEYKFHSGWNMEHMQAKIDKTKACRFVFNSSIVSSGKLWSVNYPGYYPRNMYCEYIFHGTEDEIVHIHFEYFDIEGFNQCDETTQSDFVLFSNYQTHDRTNRRFCGKTAPRGPILSESNYFRMIFYSNDIFDATGFYAHYQFMTQQKPEISRVKLTTSNSSCYFLNGFVIFLTLLCSSRCW
ncbi:unnamed protein product [Auanema sp. JU1783]|nr:unnamed protein product [Auanema sp. JU1783]